MSTNNCVTCVTRVTNMCMSQVREVCEIVAVRSAALVAMALSALLTHTGWVDAVAAGKAEQVAAAAAAHGSKGETAQKATIAFDGGVFEHFGVYRTMVAVYLRHLLGGWPLAVCSLAFWYKMSCGVLLLMSVSGSCLPLAFVADVPFSAN